MHTNQFYDVIVLWVFSASGPVIDATNTNQRPKAEPPGPIIHVKSREHFGNATLLE
jgi:hypothetical protein